MILITDPSLRKQLLIKKALLDRAVEGMGHHGLVGTSNDSLMVNITWLSFSLQIKLTAFFFLIINCMQNLHEALKIGKFVLYYFCLFF